MELTPQQKAARPLLYIGLASIAMSFAGLTSGYVVARSALSAKAQWQTIELPVWFYLSAGLIALSSIVLMRAQNQVKSGGDARLPMVLTLIMAVLFAVFQVFGWNALTDQNIFFTGPGSRPEASWLYIITWFHWIHILVGLIVLGRMVWRSARGYYVGAKILRFTLGAQFWHFLGFLWFYLLGFLIILR